ncbi:hypothetical protein Tco_0083334, partial [Tanacetum coccineum]
MHKEDQQAIGGPTSLGVTSEERDNPQLSSGNDASTVFTAEADPRKSAPIEEDEASRKIKLEDLAKLVSSVQPSFKDLDFLEDDPIIVVDDSDEDEEANEVHATINSQKHKLELEKNKAEAEAALLRAQPSFPNMRQLNELL